MPKPVKAALYALGLLAFVALSLELLLRLVFSDPDYYWEFRFLYTSPNAYQNRAPGIWTYRPNAVVREVAVYGMASLFRPRPRLVVEHDCLMRSNNLGLLQDRDVDTDSSWTVVIGDSFTAGQGGCPWVDRLQARRPDDHLVNAGLQGSGFAQWNILLAYLRQQGLVIRRILVIAISNDVKQPAFNWGPTALDCLNQNVCPTIDDPGLWMPVGMDETHSELESRSRARFAQRFGKVRRRDWLRLYVTQNSYLYKFASRAGQTLHGIASGAPASETAGAYPETGAALESLKALKVPFRVLMVPQRDEIGWQGMRADARGAEDMFKAHDVAYSWCHLSGSDFMPNDGHPNRIGYDKLAACADDALRGME
jgi:hypothetical protein